MSSPPLKQNSRTEGSPIVRHRRTKRDLTGRKLASTQTQSPEFLSVYVEWRNARLEALPENRKVDWWHEAMVKENIWHQWFSDGIVEGETMLSRSTLAHIYDNLKPKTTLPNGSTKRGPPIFRRVLPRSQGSGVFAGIAGTLIPIACFGNRASRSEACELAPERTRPVHFRSCTRCVPHLSARTSAIARGDIPTPRRPSQLGSGRAQSMLLRATGGTVVQCSPPANQT